MINRESPFFVDGNPLMALILDNTALLTIIKLIIVPLLLLYLWKHRNLKITKVGNIVLCVFYAYAVILGFLYLWR